MKSKRDYTIHFFIILLLFIVFCIWFLVYGFINREKYLKVAFLDVGQGDAIYIEAPNGRQLLIDGGKEDSLLPILAKVMPIFDKSIDMVLATHSDSDHIGGLPDVFDKYKISSFISNGDSSKTEIFKNLRNSISKENLKEIIISDKTRIVLDEEHGIYFDIIFPNKKVPQSLDSNDGSIVGRLVYGNISFMLTGDATLFTENVIMRDIGGEGLSSNVLKLGHHGSRTSSGVMFLKRVHPDIAIISAGKNNRYGHPHKEVLNILSKLNIPYLATYDKGTIMFKSDGRKLIIK